MWVDACLCVGVGVDAGVGVGVGVGVGLGVGVDLGVCARAYYLLATLWKAPLHPPAQRWGGGGAPRLQGSPRKIPCLISHTVPNNPFY